MFAKLKEFKNLKGFIRYLKNTGWLFGEKILRMTIGLLVGVWVARYLGPEQFGIISYAVSFVGIFAVISTLGLDGLIVRELVKDKNRRDELIGTAFWMKLMGAFVVIILLAVAINFTSNDKLTNILVFIIASSTIFQSFNVVDFYFQSIVMSKYVVIVNVIALFINSILKVILILNNASIVAFAWATLFDSFILAIGFIYFYLKKNSTINISDLKFSKSTAVSLLHDSWPLILSGLAVMIYLKIDQIMLKEMMNSEAVGQYAAAVRISEAWYFIPVVIAASVFPAIINAKKTSIDLYNSRLRVFYSIMIWMSITIAFPITYLSDWIINLLYGEEYTKAGSVLMIHIWASVFVFIGVASSKWLLNENLQIYSSVNTALGALINIVLNFVLIPKFGIIGAAWSTVISYAMSGYLLLIFYKKTRLNFLQITKSIIIKF